jgi:hypothetical protein
MRVDWTPAGQRCRRCRRPLTAQEVEGYGGGHAWCPTCALVVDALSRAVAAGYILSRARTTTATGVA